MKIPNNRFMHPEDAKAILALKKIPGFNYLVRKYMEYGGESLYRGQNLANHVKVYEDNFTELNRVFKETITSLGIEEPELYVYNEPYINAYTYGETRIFIAISSGAVEALSTEELKGVLAHECGHIVCHHTFYNTLLYSLIKLADYFKGIPYMLVGPLVLALQYWSRRSELSADRCATSIVGVQTYQKVLAKLASGLKSFKPNGNELLTQSYEYHDIVEGSLWNKIQQNCQMAFQSHPQLCERAYEVDRWSKSRLYHQSRSD
ncbi:MAG: M48 family metallopeptidase [Bacteroides sp.]|nr:M48 family metallopeptidase [Bacteroides sp.]